MIGDRTCIDRLQHGERRARIEDHHFADVLEREPDLLAIRCRRDIRAERALLPDAADDPMIGHGNHHRFGRE